MRDPYLYDDVNVLKNLADIEVFLHYEPQKGHNGIEMDEAIKFLYGILGES